MNTIPEFDDMADKDSYKLYKWMASRASFTIQELKRKFKFRDSDSYTTILSGIAMMGYLGIKKSDIEYYSDEELTNISPEQMSTATIIPTPLILRYVQKRENEKYRWIASISLSLLSLIISIAALLTGLQSKNIDVNITSWPATAETAQQPEIIYQYQPPQ